MLIGRSSMSISTVSEGLVRVRVRGIYATALTKLLLDRGFLIVQASNVIATRFSIPQLKTPADVTVKDTDNNRNRLLVIGYPAKVDAVVQALRETLKYSIYWSSRIGLHATVRAEIIGQHNKKCFAKLDDVLIEITEFEECEEGKVTTISIVKTPIFEGEYARGVPGARIVGDYAIVYRGMSAPKISFSEHIRSLNRRAQLSVISEEALKNGISVHWRSSANHGSEEELRTHLRDLINKLYDLEKRLVDAPPGVYEHGEKLVIIDVSLSDKRVMDNLRGMIVPTIDYHHSIKANFQYEHESMLVDYAEKALAHGASKQALIKALFETIIERLIARKRIVIEHVKLDGTVLEIGPAEAVSISMGEEKGNSCCIEARLRRIVRSSGVYDGLGVEKEPGDIIETIVNTCDWKIIHSYYSRSGELKGRYININTPPEPTPRGFRYIDLEVDIVEVDNEKRIIDENELKKQYLQGRVTLSMIEKVADEIASITKKDKNEILQKLVESDESNPQNPTPHFK